MYVCFNYNNIIPHAISPHVSHLKTQLLTSNTKYYICATIYNKCVIYKSFRHLHLKKIQHKSTYI